MPEKKDTPLNLKTDDRQEILRRWGFTCTCELCTNPKLSKPSDRNRQRLADIVSQIRESRNHAYDTLRNLAEEVVRLIETERLTAATGDLYGILAQSFLESGFPDVALGYAEMSLESRVTYGSSDHPKTDPTRRFIAALKKMSKRGPGDT